MCRRCRRNNPEPGVRGWGMHLKKVRERARPVPNDSEFHCERGGSMCRRCRRNNPEPGARGSGMQLKKKSGSGRARSQTILNSTVREEGRCAGGVGAAPPNPGPGVEGFTMVAAARRRAMPGDAAGHIARARHWAMRPGISRARGTGPGPVAAVAPASAPPAPSCSVSRRTAAPPLRRRRGLWGSRRRRLVALGGRQDSTTPRTAFYWPAWKRTRAAAAPAGAASRSTASALACVGEEEDANPPLHTPPRRGRQGLGRCAAPRGRAMMQSLSLALKACAMILSLSLSLDAFTIKLYLSLSLDACAMIQSLSCFLLTHVQ